MFKIILVIILTLSAVSSPKLMSKTLLDTGGVNTILKKSVPKTPLQIMQESAKSSANSESELPKSDFNFLPEQDSAFYRALRLQLPINVIVRNNLRFSDDVWYLEKRISEGTPWQVAVQNIRNIPPEFYNPSPVEMVQRQTMIENSFEVPFVATYKRYGLKISTEAIASMLGLTEDVSPKITYSIDFTAQIEVVVYSIRSVVVATLFNGLQSPGNYTLTWNGRNSEGKLMPPGDYIAEVRIGNERYIRKRIVIK
ncbi:MAG: FlgD immunoglobulin-like domain containing protein [Candidatus Kapabacteria bacterium]|nr:FlgD immunoglobulin-like domain containing protein [Candidatus Kapabacteria bacterium]